MEGSSQQLRERGVQYPYCWCWEPIGNIFWGVVLAAIGGTILLVEYGWLDVSAGVLWGIALIVIGAFSILMGARRGT